MEPRVTRFAVAAAFPVLVLRRLTRRGSACEPTCERHDMVGVGVRYLCVRCVVVVVGWDPCAVGRVHGRARYVYACLFRTQ